MKGSNKRLVATRSAVIAVLLLALGNVFADEVLEEESTFDIPDQPLDQALLEFSEQADVQIIMAAETARGLDAEAIHGTQRNRDALEQLLADGGLKYSEHRNRTIAVHRTTAVAAEGGDSDSGNRAAAGVTPMVMAQSQMRVQQSQASQRNEREIEGEKRPIEEIIVTGTNIRGIAPESSPSLTFDREDVNVSGAATIEDFLRFLPQNFSGGSNPNTGAIPGASGSGFNSGTDGAFGSSVNLRGLGSSSTLVLLNGNRVAPASGIGDFVDISMIPVSAIERVEVIIDGASAIYGADAVAGVVNFVLRDDFDGAETSFRYGSVTEGNRDEFGASLTAGGSWSSGNLLFSYEHLDQDTLDVEDRSFAEGAPRPATLLPGAERHSIVAAFNQGLNESLSLSADVIYSTRDVERVRTSEMGDARFSNPTAESFSAFVGGVWQLTDRLFFDLGGTFGSQTTRTDITDDMDGDVAARQTDAELYTLDTKVSGGLFEIPSGTVSFALGGQFRSENLQNKSLVSGDVSRDGERDVSAIFAEINVPIISPEQNISGIRSLEVNIAGRYEDYSDFGTTTNPKVGMVWKITDDFRVRGSYGTSFTPPPLGRSGAIDRAGSALTTAMLNGIFGVTAPDPSIANVVVLTSGGTDPDLKPETSRSYTAGLVYEKASEKGTFSASLTYFDVDFEDRLGRVPVPGNLSGFLAPNIAFENPDAFPPGTVIFNPTQEQIAEFIDTRDIFDSLVPDPFEAEIINNAFTTRNLARTKIAGLDFLVSYERELEAISLITSLSGSHFTNYVRQASNVSPTVGVLNTLYNPIDLRLRGNVGFFTGPWQTNVFVNHTPGYDVSDDAATGDVDRHTTVDFNLAYDFGNDPETQLLSGSIIRLSVINLFDQQALDTPSLPEIGLYGYDPANASPLNRFIAVELTKRF